MFGIAPVVKTAGGVLYVDRGLAFPKCSRLPATAMSIHGKEKRQELIRVFNTAARGPGQRGHRCIFDAFSGIEFFG